MKESDVKDLKKAYGEKLIVTTTMSAASASNAPLVDRVRIGLVLCRDVAKSCTNSHEK